MNWIKKNLANMITLIRLLGAFALPFVPPLRSAFFVIYTACGISDGIDGTIARSLGNSSTFGAKLDSAADLCFYTSMIICLLPSLTKVVHPHVWIIVGVILAIRIVDYIYTAVRFHRFAAMHTVLNKITGSLVFLIPYTMAMPKVFPILVGVLLLVAFISAIQELVLHIHCQDAEHV